MDKNNNNEIQFSRKNALYFILPLSRKKGRPERWNNNNNTYCIIIYYFVIAIYFSIN